MSLFLAILLAQGVFIILVEWGMWRLYSLRRRGVEFPREVDSSPFAFLSHRRMAFFVLCHTIMLLLCTGAAVFFLW